MADKEDLMFELEYYREHPEKNDLIDITVKRSGDEIAVVYEGTFNEWMEVWLTPEDDPALLLGALDQLITEHEAAAKRFRLLRGILKLSGFAGLARYLHRREWPNEYKS